MLQKSLAFFYKFTTCGNNVEIFTELPSLRINIQKIFYHTFTISEGDNWIDGWLLGVS